MTHPGPVTPPDRALLQAAAAGDTGAFETFMRRHEAPVHRFLCAFTGHDDVDDALQDTFVAAWQGAAGFRGGDSARAWLYTIARHAVHHQVRRRVKEPAHTDSLEVLAAQAGWGAEPSSDGNDAQLAHDLLQVAMSRLPADERDVLTLRELDGFSGEETAAILHVSLAAMKSRLHRARIHLAAIVRALELSPTSTERRHD